MAYYADLSPCLDYAGKNPGILAIGWLEAGLAFPTGPVPLSFYKKLQSLFAQPWRPPAMTWGVHQCSLCQFDGPSGNVNLFVPSGAAIYVASSLAVHYIGCHHYLPPASFVSAVLSCPDQSGMQFMKLLLQSGGKSLLPRSG